MKCINCSYFLNCNKADENKTECENYCKRSYETKLVRREGLNYKFERSKSKCKNLENLYVNTKE